MRVGAQGKKLKGAARFWLDGAKSGTGGKVKALEEAGAPQEVIDAVKAVPEKHYELHHDNIDAWLLFWRVQTQWLRAGMSAVVTGLDYGGVESAARMAGIEITPDDFEGLQIIEAEAMKIFAERARRD